MRKQTRTILAPMLALFCSSAFGQVRTFVATSGLDTAACSRTAPCRTFGAAIAVVQAGGEVVALETGGYGSFVIDKSVAVIAPEGIHAGIAPTFGASAVQIQAAAIDVITLRNLSMNDFGSVSYGIEFSRGATLHVEACRVSYFETGIVVGRTGNDETTEIFIEDSVLRGNDHGCEFANNGVGSVIHVVVDRSSLEQNILSALTAHADVELTAYETMIIGDGTFGVIASGVVTLDHCVLTDFEVAADVRTGGLLRLKGSTFTSNDNGVVVFGGSTAVSLGNNLFAGNSTDVSPAAGLTVIPAK